MTRTMLTRGPIAQPGGPPVDKYTYGCAFQHIDGVTFVGPQGGAPGLRGPDRQRSAQWVVVVLINQDGTMIPVLQREEAILIGS
jgi:hypothetical protein